MKLVSALLLLLAAACTRPTPPNPIPTITPTPGLWDLAALGQKPAVTWLDEASPIRSLRYESVPYDGHPTQVFAYYSDPDALRQRPPSGTKYPGVILVHGGGGKAFAEWVRLWAEAGYAALAMDLAGVDGAGKPVPQPGPDQTDYFRFDRLAEGSPANTWPYHAVASVIRAHSLLLHLPAVDPGRTALTGISWGGYLTCVVAGLDDRFKAAAPVYGCGYFDQCPRIFEGAERLSAEKQAEWLRLFDASVYVGRAKMPLLFVNGNGDPFFPVEPYQRTLALLPEARRTVLLEPDLEHGHEAGWEPTEIRLFFEQILNGSTSFPALARPQAMLAEASVGYTAPGSLRSAQFYYSTDSTSANENRTWQHVSVPVTANRLRVPLPTGGVRYGFFVVTDSRGASVSSEFLIRPVLGK
jgi:dienelactone hydrolase